MAFDGGRIANADAVRAQMEGGTLFGLNNALYEELALKDGAIVTENFGDYAIGRMAEMPPINVHFGALSGHSRLAIVGEAPVGPIQPALGNTIFAATSKRLRRTPFSRADLSWS